MSRRSNLKRAHCKKNKRKSVPITKPSTVKNRGIPSAQTLVRSILHNFETREHLSQLALGLKPGLMQRDAERIRKIEDASSINDVLYLTSEATGFAEPAWYKRVRSFGPGAAHFIAEWIRAFVLAHPNDNCAGEEEKCISALRWCEEAGVEHLLSSWDAFDDYGRSLACVMLGLMGAQHAKDRIWNFCQRSNIIDSDDNLVVGALWGLIDLKDRRAADALFELLVLDRNFYELFGFLSLAGDHRAVPSLLILAFKGSAGVGEDAMWAVTSIGHRLGRKALIDAIDSADKPNDTIYEQCAGIADTILSRSAEEAKNYFSLFYESDMSGLSEALVKFKLNIK